MRVIAGTAKSLPLKTLPGLETRPTTDRIKETLFNMLTPRLYDCSFLDLFAGSGGIGIEALSRGGAECIFVDYNTKAAACISENLAFTRLAEKGKVMRLDVCSAIDHLFSHRPFDIIFMDPPYSMGLERQVLNKLADTPCVDTDTLIIVEAKLHTDFSYISELGYDLIKEKTYKTNMHLFLQKSDSRT